MECTYLKVSDFGEKSLINLIIKKTEKFQNIQFVLGDDAGILATDNNKDLILSSDMLIQSKHFPSKMSYFQMGFKSVTVNLSDIAAMAAKPIGFLLNIAIPKTLLLKDFNDLINGVLSGCDFYDISLLGGDTNEASEIIISGTAIGNISEGKAIKKSGFNVGDLVCITGNMGLAALGFEIINNDFQSEISKIALKKALKPIAKVNEGIILRDFASSLTDITDGLASELYEILNCDKKISEFNGLEFNKGILIYEEKLAISEEYKNITKSINKEYLELILNVGEDFELLFTISKDNLEKLKGLIDFNIIGEINNGSKIEIKRLNGEVQKISSKGYEHFIYTN